MILFFGLIISYVFGNVLCQTENPPIGGNLDDLLGSIFTPSFGANDPNAGTSGGITSPNDDRNLQGGGVISGGGGGIRPGNDNFLPGGGVLPGGDLSAGNSGLVPGGGGGGLIPGAGGVIPGGGGLTPGGGGVIPGAGGFVPGGGGTAFIPGGSGIVPGNGGVVSGGSGGVFVPGGGGIVPGGGGGNIPINGGGNPCNTGECVPYYQCANGTIITDGEGILDIRIGEDTEIHPCRDLFQTCCTLKSNVPLIPDTHINEGCGFRNADGVGFRITGDKDNESQFGEFPWVIAILREEKALDKILHVFQCGGSLIHPSVVLTAAHCVSGKEPTSLKIRAGEWDTQTKDEIFPHQDRDVAEYVIHEHYYKGGLFNDIALLFLSNPVIIAENVNTACMPPLDYSFDRSQCFVSGWGKDQFGREGKYQVILKRVELPIVPRPRCQEELRRTRLGKYFDLHNSFICAGGVPGKDACKGDGGSPLVCPIPGTLNRYYQAGIVAWGIGCGGTVPGVYVNVALFRKWIDEQCRAKHININSYIYVSSPGHLPNRK